MGAMTTPDKSPHSENEGPERTLKRMIELFVVPEVEKRRLAGALPGTLQLQAFQILWTGDSQPVVRLNSEVKVRLRVVGKFDPGKKIGDDLVLDETSEVEAVALEEPEERFAHFSAVQVPGRWCLAFDFRYQKESARANAAAAEEFWDTARSSYDRGHMRAFVDNAHSTAELVAKVDLLLMQQVGAGRMAHKEVRKCSETFLHLEGLAALLERLAALRLQARYLLSPFEPDLAELKEVYEALDGWMDRSRTRVRRLE